MSRLQLGRPMATIVFLLRPLPLVETVKVTLMFDPAKNAEREKALRKLIKKWLMAQETQGKANVLLERNPAIKRTPKGKGDSENG